MTREPDTAVPDPIDESALIRDVKNGRLKSFEPLVDAHLDHLRAFIAMRLPKAHLINEIAHESFVFAFNHLDTFEVGGNFRAWLRAIAHNLVRAELQRYAREQKNQLNYAKRNLLEEDLNAAPTSVTEVDSALDHLRECVDALPPKHRELVQLRYHLETPIERISETFQRTQTSIWQTLFRIRKQLKACVENKAGS